MRKCFSFLSLTSGHKHSVKLQVGYSPTGAGAETLTLTYNIYINTHVLQ